MSAILSGLEGVVCQMDDVLVFGKDQPEHDARLTSVLNRINTAGATLNPDKCEVSKNCVKFLGHVVDENGITADPEKAQALKHMKAPNNVPQLRRFLGMANQLGKFFPNLAQITQPLRELLKKENAWVWDTPQETAFNEVKRELVAPTTLALYDPAAETKLSADASAYGLGAVLLQKFHEDWKPVAYASRSLSETERRYAQIEKEALAITWACDKFTMYLQGKFFSVETDHKPLVPLLSTKHLDTLSPRVLRFRLCLDRFHFSIQHIPGKHMYTSDTLSRAPLPNQDGSTLAELAELAMDTCISNLPASPTTLGNLEQAQNEDPVCSTVIKYCQDHWPAKKNLNEITLPYWEARGQLTLKGNLLLYDKRIVIPATKQQEILAKIHQGHQGIQRCHLRAKHSVWWPGISAQLEKYIANCPECIKNKMLPKEPLTPTPLPQYPWQRIATDLFHLENKTYLITIDYFSRYPEVISLSFTTSKSVILALKTIFSRHGIPETVVSDNGPQYSSEEFKQFAQHYNFSHVTSSPHFPQCNGQAERGVNTVKKLLKNAKDPFLSLLSYRATPLPWCKLSPSELLMGRVIRNTVPQITETLIPKWSYLEKFPKDNSNFKQKQKTDFDKRHRVKPLAEIPDDTYVWIRTGNQQTTGRVVSSANAPRSYLVDTPHGQIRCNRLHITPMPNSNEIDTNERPNRSPIRTRSRTGVTINPPERL